MAKSKLVLVPKRLIKTFHEHPEFEDTLCATLINNMYTDLFYDIKDDEYYTLSNNIELLKFIEKEKKKWFKLKSILRYKVI